MSKVNNNSDESKEGNQPGPKPVTPADIFMMADGMPLIESKNGPVTTYREIPAISERLTAWASKWDSDKDAYWCFLGNKATRLEPPAGVTAWEAMQAVKCWAMKRGYATARPQQARMDKPEVLYVSVTARNAKGEAVTTPGLKSTATHFTMYLGKATRE